VSSVSLFLNLNPAELTHRPVEKFFYFAAQAYELAAPAGPPVYFGYSG